MCLCFERYLNNYQMKPNCQHSERAQILGSFFMINLKKKSAKSTSVPLYSYIWLLFRISKEGGHHLLIRTSGGKVLSCPREGDAGCWTLKSQMVRGREEETKRKTVGDYVSQKDKTQRTSKSRVDQAPHRVHPLFHFPAHVSGTFLST